MEDRKPVDATATGLMVVVCLILGLQQVTLKATATDISPVLQIALRSGIAACLVIGLMRWRGEMPGDALGSWRPGLLIGVFFALEYLLLGEGLRLTTASRAVVFLYTAPAFAAFVLHWILPSERLASVQWFGVLLAFSGIVVAFLAHAAPAASGAPTLWGDLLSLLAGVSWGATTVVVRTTSLARLAARQTLLYQLVVACAILMAFSLLLGQLHFNPTPMVWASLAFQSIIVSFLCLLLWFWLLRHYVASRLGVLSFMTPLFGVILGVWLLNERMAPGFIPGALLVLMGIFLVGGYGWLLQWRSRFS